MLWFSLLLFAQRFQLAVMFVWRCLLFLYFLKWLSAALGVRR